ncbi:hypothetical protein WN51_02438 [Melipona quadrifasciata]|uniref:Uncharacterized protein n=1 Tax=Melipona quadrifasciata TaxID=166423 RepID=A0A0M8ZV34_9HYME|nr:hypothetical protein WN51_02438 [Melipona quadrifasciata]
MSVTGTLPYLIEESLLPPTHAMRLLTSHSSDTIYLLHSVTNERFGALWTFEAQITRPGNILPREQVVTITGPGKFPPDATSRGTMFTELGILLFPEDYSVQNSKCGEGSEKSNIKIHKKFASFSNDTAKSTKKRKKNRSYDEPTRACYKKKIWVLQDHARPITHLKFYKFLEKKYPRSSTRHMIYRENHLRKELETAKVELPLDLSVRRIVLGYKASSSWLLPI